MTTPNSMAAASSDAHGPVLTTDLLVNFKQAADLCNLRWETVRDNRRKGRYPNAVQEETGLKTWHIPVGDLVAAGHLDPPCLAEVAPRVSRRCVSRGRWPLSEPRSRICESQWQSRRPVRRSARSDVRGARR